jgi:ParB family chromosome partitioning protein
MAGARAKLARAKGAGAARRARKKASPARKQLAPRAHKRGLEPGAAALDPVDPALAPLVERVRAAGGAVVGAYHEPFDGKPLLVCVLPLGAIEPTPFQRDLSPTHAKRLAGKIEESGAFLDPVIVVRGAGGELWTPNGRHRLAAARHLGLRAITALVSPDESLAFRILALNTEKAHNLRDRSLEVIRMAQALAQRRDGGSEADHAAEFEEPALLTLGLVYAEEDRFAGNAYFSFLRRVERFSSDPLRKSLSQRAGWAARVREIDVQVKKVVAALQQRGFRSPYLRAFVVARINPVRWIKLERGSKQPPMPIGEALTRMLAAARKFDAGAVKLGDLQLVAAAAPVEAAE